MPGVPVENLDHFPYNVIMAVKAAQNYIRISKREYLKLKRLQKNFDAFLEYFEHIRDIKEARQDVKAGRVIPQERLFAELGI